jgi:rod shape-determining protein MreB
MGLFTRDLAIDLGTSNIIIIYKNKIVVDEPSVIAINVKTEKSVAIGTAAKDMEGRTPPHIQTIRPLKNGVIADFYAAGLLIRGMIAKVDSNIGASIQTHRQ